jgi:hypothetical protein
MKEESISVEHRNFSKGIGYMEDNSIEKQHVIIDHSLKKLFKTG